MIKLIKYISVSAVLCCVSTSIFADARMQWQRFTANSQTIRATFVQKVIAQHKTETAQGTLEIMRPSKFRWVYDEPYQQMIIGDGKTLWVYDVELSQATEKSMKEIIGSAHTLMLAGTWRIERDYRLTNQPSQEGLEWLHAAAKKRHSVFQSIDMGFRDNTLVKMILIDTFGQRIELVFTAMKKNIPIPADHFVFVKPKGVAVFPSF